MIYPFSVHELISIINVKYTVIYVEKSPPRASPAIAISHRYRFSAAQPLNRGEGPLNS